MALHRAEHLRFIRTDREAVPNRLVWDVPSETSPGELHIFSCRLDGTHPECSCKAARSGRCTLCRTSVSIARRWLEESYMRVPSARLRDAETRLAARAQRGTLGDASLAYEVIGDEIARRLQTPAKFAPRAA